MVMAPSDPFSGTTSLNTGLVVAERARLRDRARVHVSFRQLDAALAEGAPSESSRVLALRARQLVARRHRVSLAKSYRRLVRDAGEPGRLSRRRVSPPRAHVTASAGELVRLADALGRPEPVAPRGVAEARRLLVDATGPLYDAAAGGRLRECASRATQHLQLAGQ
jgi:hypothetical protein